MNQQEFEYIYEQFTHRRKEVLQRVLQGETDANIAQSMGIGQTTVRKHIERTCQEFGLDDKNQPGQRSRRARRLELFALFTKYKPELLNKCSISNAKDIADIETIETQQDSFTKAVLFSKSLINQTEHFQDTFSNFLLQYISRNRDKDEIIRQFQECDNEGELAKILNKKGLECYKAMNLVDSKFYLEWAIKFNSNFPEAYYNLGLVYEGENKLEQASNYYEKATKILGKENNHAVFAAINNLSRLLIIQDKDSSQRQVAIKMIKDILPQVNGKVMLKASLLKNLGWAYFQEGNYQQAQENLLQSLVLDQDYAPAHCLLAKVLEAEGDKEGALEFWKKFLECYADETKYKYLPELTGWKTDAQQALNADNA
ncbi:MAG: tetratricopeptide repeat protein [Nodularia sp. (in: Bacteria)]|nr:MAG: tetratricopeptide repeat protein [Nodularia sp. (in: cyanobacteria)]